MDSIASGNVRVGLVDASLQPSLPFEPYPCRRDPMRPPIRQTLSRSIGAITRTRVRIFVALCLDLTAESGRACGEFRAHASPLGTDRSLPTEVGRLTAKQRHGGWNGRNRQLGISSPAAVLASGGRPGAGPHRTVLPQTRRHANVSSKGTANQRPQERVKRPLGDGILPWGKRVPDTVLVATTECRSTCLLLRSTARGRGGSDNNR
jgi:hypothetical protein